MNIKFCKSIKIDKSLLLNIIFFGVGTLAMVLMVIFGLNQNIDFGLNQNHGVTFPSARVLEIVSDQTGIDEFGIRMGRQDLIVEILNGNYRGEVVQVQNMMFIDHGVHAEVGQRLVVYFERQPGTTDYFARVHSVDRANTIYVIVLLFFVLLVIVFGKAGLRSVFSLSFTFVVIVFLLIPLIINGGPPALLTIILSLISVVVSIVSIMGFSKKAFVSIVGTFIGILCYGVFYLIISYALVITGLNIPEMSSLIVIGFSTPVGLSELLFCAILIASLGAIMDVAVSLSSVVAELSEAKLKVQFSELFILAMKVGRDLIGSSSNTLILAFMGAFLVSLILFRTNNFSYDMLINRTDIAIEVLRAVSASAAMVLAAPATAAFGSYLYAKK